MIKGRFRVVVMIGSGHLAPVGFGRFLSGSWETL